MNLLYLFEKALNKSGRNKVFGICLLAIGVLSCSKPPDHDLSLSDSETKTRLIAELSKKKIDYQLGADDTIRFPQKDKKEVYQVLNQILAANPKQPISVSCELDKQDQDSQHATPKNR